MSKNWFGFDDRIYLTDYEYATYLRRPPVRYASKNIKMHSDICEICGERFTEDNPAQVSHKIPFLKGVMNFRLTPDFLDSPENLVWAHRKLCNKKAELSDKEIIQVLEGKHGNFK